MGTILANNKLKKLRPPWKQIGGKYYLSQWIISNMPAHKGYHEACGGAGSVILNKELATVFNVYNELNPNTCGIMLALKYKSTEFIDILKSLTYSEETFNEAKLTINNYPDFSLEKACREFVIRRMSRSGLGKDFGWSNRTRGGIPGDINAWNTIIEQLPLISAKLSKIEIVNKDCFITLNDYDDVETLHYIDCPYVKDTRNTKDLYKTFDWNDELHIKLCKVAKSLKGKVMISGYDNKIYNELLSNFIVKKKQIANHAGQTEVKNTRVECIWMNYEL